MGTRLRTELRAAPNCSSIQVQSGLLQRKCASGQHAAGGEYIECRQKRGQRYATNQAEPDTVPAIVYDVLSSPGQPLDLATRAVMESRFGHDFSQVRVHTDAKAAESAQTLNALAYTVRRDVAFRSGYYTPQTIEGIHLLAHELTHVLQQSAVEDSPKNQTRGGYVDQYEREAEGVAARVTNRASLHGSSTADYRVANTAPVSIMCAPDPCLDECKKRFDECLKHTKFPPECIGARSVCLQGCELRPKPEEPPKTASQPKKVSPDVLKTCDLPKGPGKHPKTVSQTIIDRWMGKHAKEGDPGEGCSPIPYIAGKTEHVCTIGYGHQIPDCPIVDKATGEKLSLDERKNANLSDLKCACEGEIKFDCKGKQAERQLRRDAAGAVKHVHEVVPVDLNQAQFDAFVDLTLHVGHFPLDLLEAIKKYWCTNAGKDLVRSIYLKTALKRPKRKKIEPGFVNRRKFRVWPPSSGKT